MDISTGNASQYSVAKLATPVMVCGAQDDVATVDVYKQKAETATTVFSINQTINGAQDVANPKTYNIESTIRSSKATLGTLSDGASLLQMASSVASYKDPLQQLNGANSVMGRAVGMAPPGVAGNILGSTKGYTQTALQVGGIARMISNSKLSDVRSLSNIINQVSGNSTGISLLDKGIQAAALVGMVKSSISAGIPGSLGQLAPAIQSAGLVLDAGSKVLPSVLKGSDIPSLKSLVGMLPFGSAKAIKPTFTKDLSTDFKIPEGGNYAKQCTADYDDTVETISVGDPTYSDTFKPGGIGEGVITDLNPMQNASMDFNKIIKQGALESTNSSEKLLLIAQEIPSSTVEQSIRNSTPGICIGSSNSVPDGTRETQSPSVVSRTIQEEINSERPVETFYYNPQIRSRGWGIGSTITDLPYRIGQDLSAVIYRIDYTNMDYGISPGPSPAKVYLERSEVKQITLPIRGTKRIVYNNVIDFDLGNGMTMGTWQVSEHYI